MIFVKAAEQTRREILKVIALLDNMEVEYLREYCQSMGYSRILAEMRNNRTDIMLFVTAGIKNGFRSKRKGEIDFALLVLGSFYFLQGSLCTLEALEQTNLDPAYGSSEIIEAAANSYYSIRESYQEVWPFGGENPFYRPL